MLRKIWIITVLILLKFTLLINTVQTLAKTFKESNTDKAIDMTSQRKQTFLGESDYRLWNTDNKQLEALNSLSSFGNYYDLDRNIRVNQCLPNSVITIDSTTNTKTYKNCKSCTIQKKVVMNNTCTPCPTSPIMSYYFEYLDHNNELTAKCVELIKDNIYLYNNSAVTMCPDGFVTNVEHVCRPCFYYLGMCVLSCPFPFMKQSDYTCKRRSLKRRLYIYQNAQVKTCPFTKKVKTGPNSEGVCLPCHDMNKYTSVDTCVDSCPFYLFENKSALTCTACRKRKYFKYLERCVKKCPKGIKGNVINGYRYCGESNIKNYNKNVR